MRRKLRGAAEAAQLDHRQREVEPVSLGVLHHLAVELKLGMYCGEVVEISQPLLPIGMKTPISMLALAFGQVACRRWLRVAINGWMWRPNWSMPATKSSKVSIRPLVPGTEAASSSMRATLA